MHAHLHRLFRWSVGRGIIATNPMADLPKPGAAVARDRVLIDPELATVWKAADKIGWPFGPAIRLLAYTAARREEVGALLWSEIHDNEIRLPGERSKSGEPRIIPLSPPAVELIRGLPRTGERVFSFNGSTAIGGWSQAKRAIDAAAAEIDGRPLEPLRIHDLRRTTATGLQRLGVGLQAVAAILGHVSGSRAGIVGVYQRHQFESEKRAALDAWAREIDRIIRGDAAPVVPASAAPASATLTLTASIPTVEAINAQWMEVIRRADATSSFEPLLEYLRRPRVELGTSELFWLRSLLERVKGFKRKKVGRFVPLGQKSRKEIYEIGAAHVHELQQTEGLSQAAAIDRVAQIYPADWFGDDAGRRLSDFMKRG
jgi:hypothetical protein